MILDCLVIFFEMFMIAFISNSAMDIEEKSFTGLTWFYIGIATLYVEVINIVSAHSVLTIFTHCFSFGYCMLKKKSVSRALYATACGIVLMTIIEMVLSIPNIFIHEDIVPANRIFILLMEIVALFIVKYIISYQNLQKAFNKLYRIFSSDNYLIAIFICAFLVFSFEVKINSFFGIGDFIVFAIYFIMIFGFCYLLYRENINNVKQKYENEQLGIYSKAYDTVLKKVRARQHEFENHLNNIANMHVMYKDYDTLVRYQTEYVGALKKSYKYNKLLNNKQPVISGFLYMEFVKYEDVNADIQYNVDVENIAEYIPIIELIEILGVLLDNAFQALETLTAGVKRMLAVYVEEIDNILYIETTNTIADEIKYDELLQFFNEGYSTKGDGHGIGLYNVKSIMKKQKGDISIRSYYEKDNYWIDITCQIERRQEKSK